jgi:uncharacterized integral membrane protein (TIGR00698 family)
MGINWSYIPPLCLVIGLIWGLAIGNPFVQKTSKIGKWCLQISVMLLGFGIPLNKVLLAGKSGFVFSVLTIFLTLLLGNLIAKWIRMPSNIATLVSFGTAICGGSAIAAASPILKANSDEIAASLATVFLLNAVSLFIFPQIGYVIGMSPLQFGEWVGLAVHDTSSVVGAALAFDPQSLSTATTVKLARALWIAPVCFFLALKMNSNSSPTGPDHKFSAGHFFKLIPWFIPAFVCASLVRSVAHSNEANSVFEILIVLSKIGLSLSLLFIGAGVSRSVFLKAGTKAFALGIVLWFLVSLSSLALVMWS